MPAASRGFFEVKCLALRFYRTFQEKVRLLTAFFANRGLSGARTGLKRLCALNLGRCKPLCLSAKFLNFSFCQQRSFCNGLHLFLNKAYILISFSRVTLMYFMRRTRRVFTTKDAVMFISS